jgi:hypothetical protein
MLSQIISASNRKILYKSLQISIIHAVASIAMIFLFIYYLNLGLYGAVISVSISKTIGVLITVLFVRKEIKIKLRLKYYIKPMITGLSLLVVFLVPMYLINFMDIFGNMSILLQLLIIALLGGLYMISYSLILILFRTFNTYDYDNLKKFCKRNKLLYILAGPLIYLIGKFKSD